jgi:transposase
VLTEAATRPTSVSCMYNQQNSRNENTRKAQASGKKYTTIKLGLDVHADTIVVVRILEHSTPQPAQTMSPEKFLSWARKQLEEAEVVYSCYEAGPFGYGLHRQLEACGIRNVVVQAVNLDERHTGVNHDKSDALELAQRLDRYVAGNQRALAVVRVPTPEEEQRRMGPRQRGQLKKELQRLAAEGRSLLLTQGYRERGQWWQPGRWRELAAQLPAWLQHKLERFKRILEVVAAELKELDRELAREVQGPRPKGLGALTLSVLNGEVGNWERFRHDRQISSYTGLCGGVSSSGRSHRQLSITKHGNGRLRTALVELAWRMVLYQRQSPLVQKWWPVLGNPRAPKGARKKAIVALARQLGVALWRWRTGRATPEQLGWVMLEV